MRRKRREDYLDSRISQRSIDLFRLGKAMLAEGFASNSTEFYEVSLGLHRALGLRPWQPDIFDFEFIMTPPSPPNSDWQFVEELHRRLAAAAG
jgi:hypothetical protein